MQPIPVSHIPPGYAIARVKGGRRRILAKVVVAHPTGEIVVAMPTKTRRFSTPSLPVEALELARWSGATSWVVRLDTQGRCYAVSLARIGAVGRLGDDGEFYVPLREFQPCGWLDWRFVERVVEI